MFCGYCGKVMPDNANYCGNCGHKIGETKLTCHTCGAEYENGQIYCEQCGARLIGVTAGSVAGDVTENDTMSDIPVTPANVASFKITGDKIQDINRLRQESGGMTIQEAKDIIDGMYAAQGHAVTSHHQNSDVEVAPNQFICQSPTVSWYKGDKALGSSSVNGILKLYSDRLEFFTTFGLGSFFSSAVPDKMYFHDIADVTKGRYMMGSSILITMKDGRKHTFASLGNKLYEFLDQVIKYRV